MPQEKRTRSQLKKRICPYKFKQTIISQYNLPEANQSNVHKVKPYYPFATKHEKLPICVDGTTCIGKSTFCDSTYKVNNYMNTESYNTSPVVGMEYLLKSIILAQNAIGKFIDRSPIANLVFQYVYYVMENYATSPRSYYGLCCEYTEIHNLESVLSFIKGFDLNIIILIDSNVELLQNRMQQRGIQNNSTGDSYKCSSKQYFVAQNEVYRYFGELMGYPVFNISELDDDRDKVMETIKEYYKFNDELSSEPITIPLTEYIHDTQSVYQANPENFMLELVLSKR